MSQVTGTNFALGSYEKFQPGFRDEKKAKNPGDEFWCETRETGQTWQNTKIITFAPIIALATLAAVSLQLNGMLMMWKIQKAMQDDAIWAARIHPSNRAEVFTWQKFQPAYRDRGWKNRDLRHPSQPALSYEHIENFTTSLEARRDLGNLAYVERPLIMSYTELN